MKLIKEVTAEKGESLPLKQSEWSVASLAHAGMIISCPGFMLRMDLDQLNDLFDIAEDGDMGTITDHDGEEVDVEVLDDGILLTRDGDKTYPNGVLLDLDTLKKMGIERPEEDEEPEQPEATMNKELEEGVKRAYRRSGKKIKRGFRVTSGFRKGRVVSSVKSAYKPRAKASTRMKLKIASKRKKIIRVLKSKRTRKRSLSKRLASLNKRVG